MSIEGKVGPGRPLAPEGPVALKSPDGTLPSRLLLASDHLPLVTVLEV